MTVRQAVVFAILMEESEGILGKSPSYIEEKLTACQSMPDNLVVQLLHPSLHGKYHTYLTRWRPHETG